MTQHTHSTGLSWGSRQILYGLWLTAFTAFVLVVSFSDGYSLAVGEVAPRDIIASHDITFVSKIRSQEAQEEAVRKVAPVYTPPDPVIARQQLERARQVLAFLNAMRADSYASEAQKYAWVLAVPELHDFPRDEATLIFTLPETNWNRVQLEFLRLLDQVMRQEEIREDQLSEAQAHAASLVPFDMAQDEAELVTSLTARFIRPNVFYDAAATEAARQQAIERVGAVFRTLRNGEVIVRKGSVVTPLDVEAMNELNPASQRRGAFEVGAAALFALVSTLTLWLYLYRFQPETLYETRQETMLWLLLSGFLLLARLLLPSSGDLLPYLFPGAALGMLSAMTVGPGAALGAVLFLAGAGGWIAGHSLTFALLLALSGLSAVLMLPRYAFMGSIFKAGLLSGFIEVLGLLAFSPAELHSEPLDVALWVGVCLSGGIISGGLTVGGLFLLTPLFDLTTSFRLMELSRPNHPLLQRLLHEAPGTFNHVMMVASLAEQAAERIGAEALLTRVGAYYHDIGKLTRPYFFSENQQGLSNPHERLDPYASADILIRHVQDGLKLAQQYHLPEKVRAFIAEHHGTTKVSFFYSKAVEAANGEEGLVDEAQFRYPGPRPQSKETLLLMLADSCEAATRARRPTTSEGITEVVDYIFKQRMEDRQMDDCPITVRELSIVRETYIELLRGAYHPRVEYPDPK